MNLKDTFDEHLLDLAQAEANFDIEKDEGRNYHQPMKFDRMGICKHCESLKIKYGSTDTKYWCAKTMNYWRTSVKFCEDSNVIVEDIMTNGFFAVSEAYIDGLSLEMVIAYCNIYGITHNQEQWMDDEGPDKEDELKVKLMDMMCK